MRRGRPPIQDEQLRRVHFNCRLPRWLVDRLRSAAEAEGVSQSVLIEQALLDALNPPQYP